MGANGSRPKVKYLEIQGEHFKIFTTDRDTKSSLTFSLSRDELLSLITARAELLLSVDISGCMCITDKDLNTLSGVRALLELKMNFLPVSGEGLKNFTGLELLYCRNSAIFDLGPCYVLNSCPKLQLLDVDECPNVTITTIEEAMKVTANREDDLSLSLIIDPVLILHKKGKIPHQLKLESSRSIEERHDYSQSEIVRGPFTSLSIESPLPKLTDDCLYRIFSYLPVLERIRLLEVCKRWSTIMPETWRYHETLDLSSPESKLMFFKKNNEDVNIELDTILLKIGKYIKHVIGIKLQDLRLIVAHCPNLVTIKCNECTKELKPLSLLASYTNLTDLTFVGPCISFNAMIIICDVNRHLKSVRLLQIQYLSLDFITHLNTQTMEVLELTGTKLALGTIDEFLETLQKFLYLTKFNLSIDEPSGLDLRLGIEVLSKLANCKELESLVMRKHPTEIGLAQWSAFPVLENLQKLSLHGFSGLSDQLIEKIITNCPLISYMDISGCEDVTDTGLSKIASLSHLHTLKMNRVPLIDGNGLSQLRGFRFRRLICEGCRGLRNKPLRYILLFCPNLELLNVAGCMKIDYTLSDTALKVASLRNNGILLTLISHAVLTPSRRPTVTPPLLEIIIVGNYVREN